MQTNIPSTSKGVTTVPFNRYPDICPFCHLGIDPISISGFFENPTNQLLLSFRCPRADCQRYFLGLYEWWPGAGQYLFRRTLLGNSQARTFSDEINEVSKMFSIIYNQAKQAEDSGLDEICGAGYRKSLEFLIKDYIIHKDESIRAEVEKELLGNAIKKRIDNDKIKDLAERAVWLGNDETHYTRKWDGKDVTDLKQLINLTVHWIDYELASEKIIMSMPQGKK